MDAGGFRLGTNLCIALPGLRWLLWLWLVAGCFGAFYFPGMVPVSYCEKRSQTGFCRSLIDVYVHSLYSVESAVTYEYESFDFCQDDLKKTPPETLGQILFGKQITSSPYKFSFKKEETCRKVCVKSYTAQNKDQMNKLAFLKNRIMQNYYHSWVIDNMPMIWCHDMEDGEEYCTLGFPIGCFNIPGDKLKGACIVISELKNYTLYPFNHVDITITYHRESDTNWNFARLVSSTIEPKSYKHSDENDLTCSGPPMEIPEEDTNTLNVIYTYSVKFEESQNAKWTSRWDYILETISDNSIQWVSIIDSFFLVLALCGLVVIIILKSICQRSTKYNHARTLVTKSQHFRWRMVQRNIFRPPENGMLLSVFLGQGAQVFIMTFLSLFLAVIAFLTPADLSALMTCAVVLWALLGILGGYVSAKMYKTFNGVKWQRHFLLTTVLFPEIVFTDLLTMNLILWLEESSVAVSFGTLIRTIVLWFGISVPLTFLGIIFGKKYDFPIQMKEMPRQNFKRSFFTKPAVNIILGSLLPFACIFIQFSCILSNIWSPYIYYPSNFLFLLFTILLIFCSEVTVMLDHFHLYAEDGDWWWKSFLSSSFTSAYIFIYAIYYFTKLQVTSIETTILYFGYIIIAVLISLLFTGS
ncbi:transmembrane 9 superfamily member 2-like [Nannospalax galili]|uniref:transmembrane 9 superfamily member 2-like n=1 Tax=Nannospalax galili TaxID=1026970 RepID=UPI0004ED405F|nr:transmembrane 9 superfamily member 2-like [Nannospalax galili]